MNVQHLINTSIQETIYGLLNEESSLFRFYGLLGQFTLKVPLNKVLTRVQSRLNGLQARLPELSLDNLSNQLQSMGYPIVAGRVVLELYVPPPRKATVR
jgi:hypothetical protein